MQYEISVSIPSILQKEQAQIFLKNYSYVQGKNFKENGFPQIRFTKIVPKALRLRENIDRN